MNRNERKSSTQKFFINYLEDPYSQSVEDLRRQKCHSSLVWTLFKVRGLLLQSNLLTVVILLQTLKLICIIFNSLDHLISDNGGLFVTQLMIFKISSGSSVFLIIYEHLIFLSVRKISSKIDMIFPATTFIYSCFTHLSKKVLSPNMTVTRKR